MPRVKRKYNLDAPVLKHMRAVAYAPVEFRSPERNAELALEAAEAKRIRKHLKRTQGAKS